LGAGDLARLKMSAIAGMVAPYPTLGEVSKRAAGAYFSPKLFENPTLKRLVRLVQRWVPETGQGRFGWPKDARDFSRRFRGAS
jgi:hypothetical protein